MVGILLSGVTMPQKLMRCFTSTKTSLRDDHPDWSSKRVSNVARAICVKRTGQKFDQHKNSDDTMFNVTFTESGTIKGLETRFFSPLKFIEKSELEKFKPAVQINDPDSILSVGNAIWATDSKNFNRYHEKELKKSAKSLIGAPCQKDHNESVESTFGVVQSSWWDNLTVPPEIGYVAELEGSDAVSGRVQKGYVRGVSVAAVAEKVTCSICGEEWSWLHEHFPGEKYDGKVCYREPRNITFRHLGFTAFPAIEGADTSYVAASVDEGFENAFAYIDYSEKHGMIKTAESEDITEDPIDSVSTKSSASALVFGESTSMSSDPEVLEKMKKLEIAEYEKARLEKEKADLEAKLEEMKVAKEQSDADLETLKEAERKRLINEVVDLQEKLDLTKGKSAEERRSALKDEPMLRLTAKAEALREMHEREEKKQPATIAESLSLGGSKSRTFKGSKFEELDPEKKAFYEKEAKLAQFAFGLFGRLPSVGAVKSLSEYDADRDRWRMDFAELLKNAKRI